MISLHSVTQVFRRGKVVLDDLNWDIKRGDRYSILGQRGSGKTTLLQLLSGGLPPTEGWVEKSAIVSSTTSLVRYADRLTSATQLVRRLSPIYYADPDEVCRFVRRFAGLDHVMNVPVVQLNRAVRQKLHLALFYGFDCDFYLFDGAFEVRLPDIREAWREAFERRSELSGMILATSVPRRAEQFGGRGGILYRGKLALYETAHEAVEAFSQLPSDEGADVSVVSNDWFSADEEQPV